MLDYEVGEGFGGAAEGAGVVVNEGDLADGFFLERAVGDAVEAVGA